MMIKPAPVEPIESAVHLCVDMQRIFARGGVWETPWMERVLPVVADIAARYASSTIFTRFVTPEHPEQRPGRWRRYYRRWEAALRPNLAPGQLDLVPELRRLVPPARIVDKPVYSAFKHADLASLLADRGIGTVVITGAETDVCVLATVLDAVDLGFRVVLVEDALCSSSDPGHDALMTMYRTRYGQQIDLLGRNELFDLWRP
ncbi:cysteine hydrolase [Rhodopseudomonas sp. WA056]|uniref:Isochorismatase hydrolase n=2 Tax=Rhodopseudomonas TaxID=1073 RepID=E6VKH1_RHOPX|nr:cysteine hydrolase [Rhodopseudomonas sp. WA056]